MPSPDRPSLDRPSTDLLDDAFTTETDRLTGTSIRAGNTVELLPKGVASYAKRWELIEGAERTLHMVSFSFMRDDTTRRLRELVKAKVRDGVEVKMIVDDAALYTTWSRAILSSMSKAGAEILTYVNPFHFLDVPPIHPIRNVKLGVKRRFHEKYMVADGTQAVLGGMNWGTKYALGGDSPKAWRDTDVHLRGPVVADIERRFLEDVHVYRELRTRRLIRRGTPADLAPFKAAGAAVPVAAVPTAGTERIRYIGHKPWDEQAVPLTNFALQLIAGAQREIYWGCHGVRPPRIMAEHLAAAAARGVEVHLITNSKKSSRSLMGHGLMGWMYWECSHHFRWLIDRNIRVYTWQRPGAFHSKCMVVDGSIALVGSYNVANGSAFHHTESAVAVYGGSFPGQIRAQFAVDLGDCVEVTEARRPLPWVDPMRRRLHERNLLIDAAVWPPKVGAALAAGRVKWKYSKQPAAQ